MQSVRCSRETNTIIREKKVKVKAKFTLEQAMKAQRRSRDLALLFLQPVR
jgi:hypothetical protein